ncbi:hypothetical protein HF086_005180 [Spodoptera exigua]|uniref:Odorant receptor n=1 Tax=Spodoptera exigua TaxID=7107 RepID=A0A922ME15_SPOEX|nr:hypothetical protein HF086_005180 [Spodoptera exigua]
MDEAFLAFHRVLSFAGISIFAKQNWDSNRWLVHQTFNFIIGVLCFIFTTGFVVTNVSDFLLCIQGACIWTTGVIMTITLGVCLIFRKDFRNFLEEMAFRDHMLEMPLIDHVLLVSSGGEKIQELRDLVTGSQEKLFKYTTILLRVYVASVFLCATLYLCSPVYGMMVREDESLRLLAFDMWFPWSLEDYTVYIISFIFHAYAGYLCCIAYPGLQSIIILLLGQIIRQIRILTFILLHMNDFSNRLNVICRPFYLTLILVAIMLVCMCSVKIAVSNKVSLDTMKYYIHEFCFILVVLMFCLVGQQVDNENRR